MSQCLYITLAVKGAKKIIPAIQKRARSLSLEGTAQTIGDVKIVIMICGTKTAIDDFVDSLHKEAAKKTIEDIQIEPFMKTKDYRGVFRIIE